MTRNTLAPASRRPRKASPVAFVRMCRRLLPARVCPGSFRFRLFDPWTTFGLFLWQILEAHRTCREVLCKAQACIYLHHRRLISGNTSAYCQARARLALPFILKVHQVLGVKIEKESRAWSLWHHRRVVIVDGSGLSMPDTPKNQAAYPQGRRQKRGCGFPVMRIVGVFSLATGAWLSLAEGALSVSESTLFRSLWPSLRPHDVVLADRGFCSFAVLRLLAERKIDCVMRLHARRSVGVRLLRRLSRGDLLVEWLRTPIRPSWMHPITWRHLPQTFPVRHLTVPMARRGFRTRSLAPVTTLLDAKAYPPRDIAELYLRRWKVELFLKDIKITMGMDILRCKTPALIRKELWMHIVAYNLIRLLMAQASSRHGMDPFRISFSATVSSFRQWFSLVSFNDPLFYPPFPCEAFLLCLTTHRVPCRPGRAEPRAVKRRPKNYQRLTQPRSIFHEVPHRNHYHAPLS